MIPRILVTRTGSPLYCNPLGDRPGASPRGDIDTAPLLRRLCDTYEHVAYYGDARDTELLPENLERWFDVPTKGVDCMHAHAVEQELMAHLDPVVEAVAEWRPTCVIEVSGPPSTWAWVRNPNWSTTLDYAVKWVAPQFYLYHRLQWLPRYCVVTDPKVYPRNSEMTTMWPAVTPRAVLSQEQRTWQRKIAGVDVTTHAVYGACEYWPTYKLEQMPAVTLADSDIVWGICANAHLAEPRLPKGRTDLWTEIFDAIDMEGTRVCGAGWEKHPYYKLYPDAFVGSYTFPQLMKMLNNSWMGVMIPQAPGFATTKVRLYALASCIPRMFGDGEHPMTYDRDARVLPLDHPSRFVLGAEEYPLAGVIEEVLEKTTPNYDLLDALVQEPKCRWPEPDWLARYGGMTHANQT